MSTSFAENDLNGALLEFVTEGTFPVSEAIVSAEFPASSASQSLRTISAVRERVENEICELSRQTPPDIDGWISQARQLHADIERSRVTAREIVLQHEKGQQFRQQVAEATEKVHHLQSENTFNRKLYETVEAVRAIQGQLATAHESLNGNQNHRAVEHLKALENALATSRLSPNSHVLRILSSKCSGLRSAIGDSLRRQWNSFAQIDQAAGQMTITCAVSDIESTLADLSDLGLLEGVMGTFQRDLLSFILEPVVAYSDAEYRTLVVEGKTLRLETRASRSQVSDILDTITAAFKYLHQWLPPAVIGYLRLHLFPAFRSELIAKWIAPAVPTNMAGMAILEQLIGQITQFTENLKAEGWHGVQQLDTWTEQIPRLWVNQRRAQSLDDVRSAIISCNGSTSTVERVEKERVSKNDNMFVENGAEDDWNAEWSSDNENDDAATRPEAQDNDEDISAWGLDDDADIAEVDDNDQSTMDDDVDEAWGWGDEDDGDIPTKGERNSKQEVRRGSAESPSQREMVLREFYEVTDIPNTVLSVVSREVSDGEMLSDERYAQTRIAASGQALFALPTLIIAMFKATAPLFYPQKFRGGQMLLYNDSMYLAEQLQSFSTQHNMTKSKSDVDALERFGRVAYGKEMHSQRTVLMDLLDGCQGFMNCAAQPFLTECENSVASTVERLRQVHKEWEPILSRSALLQSIGSLLSTVVDKVIIDVEDLGDISDAQSQQLVGFCNTISKLEDLFLADRNAAGATEPIPMTAMYVSNWLKFQYLINVLEGSLADIKYFWREGGLSLEFSQEEVVDLLKALFADSDHRKRAVEEIRSNT